MFILKITAGEVVLSKSNILPFCGTFQWYP